MGLILAQSIGRWGNFFNGEAFGRIVSEDYFQILPFPEFIKKGMFISGYYREPTFLYESIISFLGFIVLIGIRRRKKLKVSQLTGIYLIWYGMERFIVEQFRSDSLMLGSLKIAQLISILFIIVGIFFTMRNRKNNKYYYEERIKLEN